MGSLVDIPDSTAAATLAPAETSRLNRTGLLTATLVVLAVVAASAFVVNRQATSTTAEEFTGFAQELDTLSAPQGEFSAIDPTTDVSYADSAAAWGLTGTYTWIDTTDPSSFSALRGWTTTAPADQGESTCKAAIDWFAATATTLALTPPGNDFTLAKCVSAFESVQSSAGTVSDAGFSRGTLTSDGQPQYGATIAMHTGPEAGQVVVQLIGLASVSNA